jgi:hypothetical protein
MADPTQPARDLVKKGLSFLVPDNSPLAQSKDSVLTPEARAKLEAEKAEVVSQEPVRTVAAQAQAPTNFVPQSNVENPQSSQVNPINMINQGMNLYGQGLLEQGAAQSQGAAAQAKAYDDLIQSEQKIQAAQAEEQKAQQQKLATLESDLVGASNAQKNFNFSKPDIWKNKSTGQKILFGIGAFLGSITPQGAANVAKIIDTEIDRDVAAQKLEYEKLGSEKTDKFNIYKTFYDKYKDSQVAAAAAKAQRLELVGFQLKKLEATTQSKVALGKIKESLGQVEMAKAKEVALIQEKLGNITQQNIPGFKGKIKDEVSARKFAEQRQTAEMANAELNKLLKINDQFLGGALSFDSRATAEQSQTLLIGQLREILVGPGSMSDSDKKLLQDAIANPTDFFSRKSSNKIKLESLKQAIKRKVNSSAISYGLEPDAPMSREI